MPADLSLSQADAEDLGISLVASLLSAVQADRLLAHIKAEPARLAAAKAEGVREGVEACAVWLETQAAAFLDARDQHMRACEATKGGSLAEEMHSRRACSAEATAASLSEAAAGLRRLCPPSAKPDAAVAEVGSDK